MSAKKQIKISIEIEKDSIECGYLSCKITDMLFTDISGSVLESVYTIEKVKKVISKFKGFDMLTITLQEGNQMDLYAPVLSSYRYTNRYNEFKRAKFVNNSYNTWLESSVKNIYEDIKNITEQANRQFISLLQENAA